MPRLTARHYAIVLLVLFTAVVHIAAALDRELFPPGHWPDPLFILNGLGYLGLLAAYFLPIPFLQSMHKTIRWILIGYVAVTIVAWLVIWVGFNVIRDGVPFFSRDSLYGVPSKLTELVLLALLWNDK